MEPHMFQILYFASLIFLFHNRTKKRKKARGLDAELRELIENPTDITGIAFEIKRYLLSVIDDDNNDREKFSDAQLARAASILDRAGPSAFYWMTDIASQLALISAAQINGIPTNVSDELREGATAESIVEIVVRP